MAALNDGLVFSVETSDDLTPLSWTTAGVSETLLSDNGILQSVKATLPVGPNGRRFARLKVLAR